MDGLAFFPFHAGFLAGWSALVLTDILLSADNAMAVSMAARSLPPHQRLRGVLIGSLGAVCLRFAFTGYASQLMQAPFLKLAGGAVILWIAIKLLVEQPREDYPAADSRSLWAAVPAILIADASMSLDNVLAVAGISGGETGRLWTSLGLTIPLMFSAGAFVSALLARFPIVLYAGAALLAKTGGGMIVSDPGLAGWWLPPEASLKLPAETLALVAVFLSARRLRRALAGRPAAVVPDTAEVR